MDIKMVKRKKIKTLWCQNKTIRERRYKNEGKRENDIMEEIRLRGKMNIKPRKNQGNKKLKTVKKWKLEAKMNE